MIKFTSIAIMALFLSSTAEAHIDYRTSRPGSEYPLVDRYVSTSLFGFNTSCCDHLSTPQRPAVPFARLDVSRHLDPWYDLVVLQLELASQRRAEIEAHVPEHRWNDFWRAAGLSYVLIGSLCLLLLHHRHSPTERK